MDFRGVPDQQIKRDISTLGKTPHGELIVELLRREIARFHFDLEIAQDERTIHRLQGRIAEIHDLESILTAPVQGS